MSKDAQFSLGPWTVQPPRTFADVGWDIIIRSANNDPICSVGLAGYMKKKAMANARLIAAAPELMAACQEFVRKVDAGEAKSTRSYEQMKAALQKARDLG